MTSETMTVHKALAELKVIDSRILGAISSSVPCAANKHSNTKIDGVPVSQYIDTVMKPGYQKVCDLITRRNAIKRAVVLSNAKTEVEICGQKFTVAEAIDMKNHGMELQRKFLSNMALKYSQCVADINRNSGETLSEKADKYIAGMYGNKDGKVDSDEAKKARDEYIAANTYDLVDPIGIKKVMDDLESHISEFETEVDAALSCINAQTEITIEY